MGALEDDLDEGVRRCVAAGHNSLTTHTDGSPCTPACPIHPEHRLGVIIYDNLAEADAHRSRLWGEKGAMFAAVELGGEVGEALNVVKKLERERIGMAGSRATVDDLADELGDVVICCQILASKYGIDLTKATARKFNKTSRKMGFLVELKE